MKRLSFSIWLLLVLCVSGVHAQTKHDRNVERYKSSWDKLIPRYVKLQFAGSMGFLSAGVGWDYGRSKHWETDVLIGFVPAFKHDDTKITLTLKQNYMPWKIRFSPKFMFEPLACGIYINTIFSDNFWARTPIKYPSNKYYSFSTRIRTHVFLGERITLNFDPEKRKCDSLSFFYELSTNDLYFISAVSNRYVKLKDILSLSFGLKLQFL